jgi:hypothetical protein
VAASSTRLRLATALAAAVVLAAVAGVILLLGGEGQKHSFEPAPDTCVTAWNEDPAAVSLGRHQFSGHGYGKVQVLGLAPESIDVPKPVPTGDSCAVVFASDSLDVELGAAASVRLRGNWQPLNVFVAADRLAALQAQAEADYNAELDGDGIIDPLD